jgi:hypothetical protein
MSEISDQVATSMLFENRRIRVWEMVLAPGQASDWHTHMHDYVFVNLDRAQISLKVSDREPIGRSLDEGFAQYVAVGPDGEAQHQLANAGEAPLRQVLIELLGPSEASEPSEPENNGRFL